jgi:anti-sigma factor RsiW
VSPKWGQSWTPIEGQSSTPIDTNGISTPIYRRTSDVVVTVVMFHANEPGAKNAFDAAAILKRYSAGS